MTLFEGMQVYSKDCFDTCDEEWDCIVTVDKVDAEPTDNLEKFSVALYKKVELVKFFEGAYAEAIVKWSDLIARNRSLFEGFVSKYWNKEKQYVLEDEEEFFCQWLQELHLLLAGYGNESTYELYVKLIELCK